MRSWSILRSGVWNNSILSQVASREPRAPLGRENRAIVVRLRQDPSAATRFRRPFDVRERQVFLQRAVMSPGKGSGAR